MKTLQFFIPNNLSLLHDQLLAAMPELGLISDPNDTLDPDGSVALVPVMQVEGNDNDVRLTVPDAVDEAAITQVVQAHDPTQTQPDLRAERHARMSELLQTPRSSWTTAQLRDLLQLAAQEVAA